MKTTFFLLITMLFLNFNSNSQVMGLVMEPEYSSAAFAKIAILENEHDFGDIDKGVPVSHTFEFINEGDAPLIITSVKTSCGCTATEYTKEAISPGAKGELVATYNASKEGSFNKSIRLLSNGGDQVLFIKGTVN